MRLDVHTTLHFLHLSQKHSYCGCKVTLVVTMALREWICHLHTISLGRSQK